MVVFLFFKVRLGGFCVFVGFFDVNFVDEVLIFVFYVFEIDVVEDICVVDQDVDMVECFNGSVDDFVVVFDVVVVGNCFVVSGFDFVNDNIGSLEKLLV